ncbi:hypothetical protein So717_42380 [Roseobacter cerasinus]|uniref:TOD1/MUCI70 glycosyltransferase-like domain-containing protein n=1 Tax=Roseobacter cerasinus TaxID=2602289 RepID=A0A640VZY2_9RHOB|nr:glycosyltransferase domain-containing protein [Roseobacter cerasinus]GFE52485.1 hypothetical protein So717_42380 [Roseobacter cerasinus]
MTDRIAIYTCVVGKYDVVLPPLERTPGADYLLFTDQPGLRVRGWRTLPLASETAALSPSLKNRFHKLFPHKALDPSYDMSIYHDGNIRTRKDITPLLSEMGAHDIGLFPHEKRSRVAEEIEACLEFNKVSDPQKIYAEYDTYTADGFTDAPGCLSENAVLFRRHKTAQVIEAMELWWDLVAQHSGRDQISLPYVLYKTGITAHRFGFNYRIENPWFHYYRHWTKPGRKAWLRVYTEGRIIEGLPYRILHKIARRL